MSYILEALRRAESERERKRGGVPGLHAQPVPLPSPDDIGERRGRPWMWIASGLSVAVVLLILWRWWSVEPLIDESALARAPVGGNVAHGSAEPPATATTSPPAAPVPAAPAPAQPAPTPPAAAAPAPAPKPAASAAAPDNPPRSSKPAQPPRSSATAAAPAPAHAQATPPTSNQAPSARNPATTAPPPVAAAPAPAPERLRTLAELPEDLRRTVPQLAFGGSVYSDTPSQRMVIFNGQVMREGDAVNDELQIEQIRPRSAVLRVRGQRFEMPF